MYHVLIHTGVMLWLCMLHCLPQTHVHIHLNCGNVFWAHISNAEQSSSHFQNCSLLWYRNTLSKQTLILQKLLQGVGRDHSAWYSYSNPRFSQSLVQCSPTLVLERSIMCRGVCSSPAPTNTPASTNQGSQQLASSWFESSIKCICAGLY